MQEISVMSRDNPMFAARRLCIVFSLCGAPFGASKINTRAAFTFSQEPYVYGNWSALRQKCDFASRH